MGIVFFCFFDDFNDGVLNTSKWDTGGANFNRYVSENNGIFALTTADFGFSANESDGHYNIWGTKTVDTINEEGVTSGWLGFGLRSVQSFGLTGGIIIETSIIQGMAVGQASKRGGLFGLGVAYDKDNLVNFFWMWDQSRTEGGNGVYCKREINGSRYSSGRLISGDLQGGLYHRLTLKKAPAIDEYYYYNYGGITGNQFFAVGLTSGRIALYGAMRGQGDTINYMKWNWIFARKYVSSDPTFSLGAEESIGNIISISSLSCPSSLLVGEVGQCSVVASASMGTLGYSWYGDGVSFGSPQASQTSVSFSQSGIRRVYVDVYLVEAPSVRQTVSADVDVVLAPYAMPEFSIRVSGSSSGQVPLTVIFSAEADLSSVRQYNPQFTYRWDFGDGSLPVEGKRLVAHTYRVAGNYTVVLRVEDGYGRVSISSVGVAVSEPQDLTVRQFKVYYSNKHMRVPLRVIIRPVLEYMPGFERVEGSQWRVGTDLVAENRSQLGVVFTQPGDFSINFSGQTNYGRTLMGSFPISVKANQKPSCSMEYEDYPSYGYTKFTPSCVDPDGRVRAYFWEFGNGETSKNRIGYAHYERGGSYTVKLRVVDDSNEEASFQWNVSVTR